MTLRTVTHNQLVIHTAVVVLVIVVLRMPAAQSVIVGGLVELANLTERVVRFPCGLSDHSRCFSLDRFDPTCPQCM